MKSYLTNLLHLSEIKSLEKYLQNVERLELKDLLLNTRNEFNNAAIHWAATREHVETILSFKKSSQIRLVGSIVCEWKE